jgi:hypothetical protein
LPTHFCSGHESWHRHMKIWFLASLECYFKFQSISVNHFHVPWQFQNNCAFMRLYPHPTWFSCTLTIAAQRHKGMKSCFHDFMNSCFHAFVPTSHKYLVVYMIQSFNIHEGFKIYIIWITSSKDKKLSMEGKWLNWSVLRFQTSIYHYTLMSISTQKFRIERIFIGLDRLWWYWSNLL